MSFLKRLFGQGAAPGEAPAAPAVAPRPATDTDMIRGCDAHGRELLITREDWLQNVLLGNLEKSKGDPETLANMVTGALRDGFAKEIVPYAEHLHQSDSVRARGATLLGIVYLRSGRLDDAERVLREHLDRYGEDAYVLTNIAKVQDARGDRSLAERTLWHALEIDPNQDDGLAWYLAINRDRGGAVTYDEACRRVAGLPRSWRAQLWLAREALQRQDLSRALALYEESLSRAGHPPPAELLMQLSGDLGNAGHLSEILELAAPRFDVAQHGLEVGNNLIKANLDLGRLDDAKRIVDQLYAVGRPDWRKHLEFWDGEVSRLRVAGDATHARPEQLKVDVISIEGPLWLRDASPCAALVTAKSASAPRVTFLGSTVLVQDGATAGGLQLADGPGRLSRALPLVMAEQVQLATRATGVALIPWVDGAGFAVFGKPHQDTELYEMIGGATSWIGHVVIEACEPQYRATLRLLRVADRTCVGASEVRVNPQDPAPSVESLLARLMELLRQRDTGIREAPLPPWYRRPGGSQGSHYLLRLEQQLAVVCSALMEGGAARLTSEHEIVAGAIDLCLAESGNATVRMLLAQTLRQMKKVRPDLLAQYKARVDLLQREHPIPGVAGAAIERSLEVFAPPA